MSIKKVETRYYYSFMMNGKRYNGTCKDCRSKAEAVQFESKIRDFVKNMRTITNEKALLIQYHREITGAKDIPLAELAEIAIRKPQAVNRSENENYLYRIRWKNFVSFMNYYYPEVKLASDILKNHAEHYIQFLNEYGAFNKAVFRGGKIIKCQKLAPATILQYISSVDFILTKTKDDTGISGSPFFYKEITRPKKINAVDREAFTPDELRIISENMFQFPKYQKLTAFEKMENPPRLGQLFMIAFYTGLRLGDCCNLRWKDIDFQAGIIRVKTRKTGKDVEIPIMPELFTFLIDHRNKEEKSGNLHVFIFPFWQDLHRRSASQICYYVKSFFKEIGIQSNRISEAGRKQPVKTFHSFRHTFATLAISHGIPLNVVQSIVGHSSAKMTEYYSRHVSADIMRNKMHQIPALIGKGAVSAIQENKEAEQIREKIISLLHDCSFEHLQSILLYIQKM